MNDFKHYPVMLKEAVNSLDCRRNLLYIDATLGGGGYSKAILEKISDEGRLISFDVDKDAIEAARAKLKDFKNLTIVNNSYTCIKKYLEENNIPEITGGIVFDLGASYHQLTSKTRGFSFMSDAKLDMRFNQEAELSAYDVVNGYKEDDLVKIFSGYGEERFSKRIAKKITETRKKTKIKTTKQLADLILEAAPRIKTKIHPASRVFQALRIEVNDELNNLQNTLHDVLPLLSIGAIITVVSFHSLEDRIVKNLFRECSKPERGEMQNNNLPLLELLNKKPLTASMEEIGENPPSRSAKLRAARRIQCEKA